MVKASAYNAGDLGLIPGLGRLGLGNGSPLQYCCLENPGFDPWVGKVGRRKWQPTPVLLPGKSYGQRSLAGCSPWSQRVGHA